MQMQMTPDASNQTLAEIVTYAQTGEGGAIEALVLRCRAMAIRHAFAILGDRSLAEDVAQEALAQAVASLGDLRAPEAFLAWLRRIVHRHCDRVTRARRLLLNPSMTIASVVYSAGLGVAKPHPEFFVCADRPIRTDCPDAKSVVFIDDSEANVRAARAHGWTTLHFSNYVAALLPVTATG